MKVLIADDEFNNRMLLQKLMSQHNASSDMVVDGQEAVDAFVMAHADGEPYNLILMDIMMPEMDGHKAVSAIRTKEKELGIHPSGEVKIIMVTALDSPKDVIKAYYRDGATDYMVKPVNHGTLTDKLKNLGLLS
ncbi:MAG: response regulator [Magnetococcales bacterium]|nr:response regulator [Magnetococcales bacterium]